MLVRYIYFMVQRWISQGPCPPAQRSTVWRWPCVKPHRRERAPAFIRYILYIVLQYIYICYDLMIIDYDANISIIIP